MRVLIFIFTVLISLPAFAEAPLSILDTTYTKRVSCRSDSYSSVDLFVSSSAQGASEKIKNGGGTGVELQTVPNGALLKVTVKDTMGLLKKVGVTQAALKKYFEAGGRLFPAVTDNMFSNATIVVGATEKGTGYQSVTYYAMEGGLNGFFVMLNLGWDLSKELRDDLDKISKGLGKKLSDEFNKVKTNGFTPLLFTHSEQSKTETGISFVNYEVLACGAAE